MNVKKDVMSLTMSKRQRQIEMATFLTNELRRYSTEEYAVAHLSALYDGADVAKRRVVRMTNLEALAFRGFKEEYNPMSLTIVYVHEETGLRVSDDILERKDAWKIIDKELEYRK